MITFASYGTSTLRPDTFSVLDRLDANQETGSVNPKTRIATIATFISKHEIYPVLVTQAYCVKCKTKRDMKNEKQITMKNGRQALSGTCSVCGTKMFRIGGGSALVKAKQHTKVKAASKKRAGKTKAKTSKSKKKR